MTANRIALAAMAFVFGAGIAAAAGAQEDGRDNANGGMTRSQFVDTQSYFANGSGLWRQKNPAHKPGDGTPVAWLQFQKWGPGRDSVIVEMQGVHDDGSCEFMFVTIKRYDPAKRSAELHHFGPNGLYITGAIKLASEDALQATVSGVLPDGSALVMRDTSKLDDPAAFSVQAERWDEEAKKWRPLDEVTWTKMEGESPCRKG